MIALIKLYNGQEVIGSVKDDQDNKVILEDPMQINYRLVATQPMPTVSVSRYMPFSMDKIFAFEKKDLLHIAQPRKAMADYYLHALNNYREVIDENVEQELLYASGNDDEGDPDDQDMSDAYKALLERIDIKGPVN
jgi:hypothetical protein